MDLKSKWKTIIADAHFEVGKYYLMPKDIGNIKTLEIRRAQDGTLKRSNIVVL